MAFIPKAKREPWRGKVKKPQEGRKRPNQKFYNSARWRRAAKAQESKHPTCEQCKEEGKVTDATGRNGVTDHVYSVNKAQDDYQMGRITWGLLQWYLYDEGNLKRLCHTHHNSKSGKERHQ